jgi:hypothetical protein
LMGCIVNRYFLRDTGGVRSGSSRSADHMLVTRQRLSNAAYGDVGTVASVPRPLRDTSARGS